MLNYATSSKDFLRIFQNHKGHEYVGSRFAKSLRPERVKTYEGPYARLKTSIFNEENTIVLNNGENILERILLPSYGLTSVKFYGHQSEMLWSYPSAGACYPVEVYLVIRRLHHFEPGVYHYSALQTSLHKIGSLKSSFLLNESLLEEHRDADFYIIVTADPWRSCWKYSHRGYRFSLIDSGHALANFHVTLDSLGFDYATYTSVNSQYLKTLLSLNSFDEAFSVIAVNWADAGERTETEHLDEVNAYSRCITTVDTSKVQFDWAPIRQFQTMVNAELKEPQADWLMNKKTMHGWDYKQAVRLLSERRSTSAYLPKELKKAEVNTILSRIQSLRLPIQIYCIVHAVEDMAPGVYKYNNDFELIQAGSFVEESVYYCLGQGLVREAPVLFLFTVDVKENDRSYAAFQQRLLEVGYLGQMMYLHAQELDLGYSAIGGYYDEEVKDLLKAGADTHVIYAGTLGYNDTAFEAKRDRYYLNKPKSGGTTPMAQDNRDNQVKDMTITDLLYRSVLQHGSRTAICFGERTYSYTQMWEEIVSYSNWLKQQVSPEYPVGICLKNCPEYLFIYYACLLEGYLPMLIDHTFTEDEVSNLCKAYFINSVISLNSDGQITLSTMDIDTELYVPGELENVATCRFSSGTTGRPKCLMFTHEAIIKAGVNWAAASGIQADDKVLCTALFHNGLAFNTSMLAVFVKGASLTIHKQITPKSVWETISNQGITILVAFPVVYDLLNNSKYCNGNHRLRLCLSSAAPLHYTIKEAFYSKVRIEICDYYGIVECGPCTYNSGSEARSLGRPVPGVTIRILDKDGNLVPEMESGIIQIKSESMASGYYRAEIPFQVTDDGFYQTTDIGYLKDGHLYINGRSSDLINVAGKKVDPLEVENVLLRLPAIRDAAVVGVMNERQSTEYPVAFIVKGSELESDEIINHCQQYLAPFKLPQKYVFVPQIPRSGVGKVRRKQLIDEYLT